MLLPLRTRCLAVATVAIALASSGCGAKTGLHVPDSARDVQDAADVEDVFDGFDAFDATDTPDTRDVPEPDIFEACVPGTFVLVRRNVDVMFLIDRSLSMSWDLSGQAGVPPSRWSLLGDALMPVLTSLQDSVALGALYFPQPPVDMTSPMDLCALPTAPDVPVGSRNAMAILSVQQNTMPNGGTPTFDALAVAQRSLTAAGGRGDAKYMVLATDGGPNCNFGLNGDTCVCIFPPMPAICRSGSGNAVYDCLDDDRTVGQMATIAASGIPIFVIGIADQVDPGLHTTLNRMAVAGGRPLIGQANQYYSVRQPGDLTAALSAVRDQIARCAFVTPSRPDNPNDIALLLNGAAIPRDTTRANGWDWTDVTFGEVTLFGAACEIVVNNPDATLTARVGCIDH